MPFVKLDCDILDSSLWLFDPARILFLTALCMASPREFDEPIKQISVHNLEPTGFEAPPGWYGFLRASPMSLIQRARVADNKEQLDQAFEALEELGDEDIDSRSHAFEGRRLIRIDGGFVVLRFMEFRDHDYKNAERQRRWREREKARNSNAVTPVTDNGSNECERVIVTQAEDRRQKTEEEKKECSLNGSVEPCQTALPLPVVSKPKKSPMMSGKALRELKEIPAYEGIDLDKEAWKFKTWCETNNKTQSTRRFVNWLNRIT